MSSENLQAETRHRGGGLVCGRGILILLINASQSRRVVEAADRSQAWNRVLCDRVKWVHVPELSARGCEAFHNAAVVRHLLHPQK